MPVFSDGRVGCGVLQLQKWLAEAVVEETPVPGKVSPALDGLTSCISP